MSTTLLVLAALVSASVSGIASGTGADAPATIVPAGETRSASGEDFWVPGDLVVEGDLVATTPALTLHVPGDLVVRGRILAAPGATGAAGGSLTLLVGGLLQVAEGGRVAAGAGGHGEPSVVEGGEAVGGDGGMGGSLVITAATVDVLGVLAPGQGGRGGDAFGAAAVGGDGGDSGAVLVNGARYDSREVALNPVVPVVLADLLGGSAASLCAPVGTGTPLVGVAGGDGGDACADGTAGVNGVDGNPGDDDNCGLCTTANHPPCGNYTPVGGDNRNGEKGQDGLPSLVGGGPAHATGGAGGAGVTQTMPAGNGGDAVARGGNGGRGGHGGMGGDGATTGDGCRGGNGASGSNGGPATAIAGAQGVNPLDCSLNGVSGNPDAFGGAAGAGGWGGAGGGGNWPWSNGAAGYSGSAGSQGYGVETDPPEIPCFLPDKPTVVVLDNFLDCTSLTVRITQPAITGNSAILDYNVYRGTSPYSTAYLGTIPYAGPVTSFTDPGLSTNTTYYYRVSAVTAIGEGPKSALASATPICPTVLVGGLTGGVLNDPIPASTPPGLAGLGGPGSGQVTLLITHPAVTAPVIKYKLYRGLASGSTVHVADITNTSIAGETYTDSGLLVAMPYYYNVTAVTASGEGPSSVEIVVATPVFLSGGTGGGYVSESQYGNAGTPPKKQECKGVPMQVSFTMNAGTFVLRTTFGGSRDVAPGGLTWCQTAPPQESRTFTNRQVDREAAKGEAGTCSDPMMVDSLVQEKSTYTIYKSCKNADGSSVSERTILTFTERGTSFRQDLYTMTGGRVSTTRLWHAEAFFPAQPA